MTHNRKILISAKQPPHVYVYDQPPRLGGKSKKVPRAEFEKESGYTIDENIYVSTKIDLAKIDFQSSCFLEYPSLNISVEEYFNHTQDRLAIAKMDSLGYGVFAMEDILPGSIVTIYSGTIIEPDDDIVPSDEEVTFLDSPISVSCRHSRGLGALMQHLPTPPLGETAEEHVKSSTKLFAKNTFTPDMAKADVELLTIKFEDEETRHSVQTKNVCEVTLLYKGHPVFVFIADRLINAGEQIGFDYGNSYWSARTISPALFDKDGAVISPLKYLRTYGALPLNNETMFIGDYAPLVEKCKKPNHIPFKDVNGNPSFISSPRLAINLFLFNAVRFHFHPVELAVHANIITNQNKIIHQIEIESTNGKIFFEAIKGIVGDVIKKDFAEPIYSISFEWMQKVYERDVKSLQPLLDILKFSLEGFEAKVLEWQNGEEKKGLALAG